jgi:hypothetical protein
MSNLKPIGSEKLTGQQKIQRIMEIARFNEVVPEPVNETSKSQYSITLADGNNYQIVKERQGYIIKKTISESVTDYIEPMKNRKYYSSYSQAFKRVNLLAKELNRLNENEEGVSLFGEQKKFVLKTPKPAASTDTENLPPPPPPSEPPPVPSPQLPPSPVGAEGEMPAPEGGMPAPEGGEIDDMGMEDMSSDTEMTGDEDMGYGDKEDQVTFKSIQKLTGKLTQKIRTLDNQEGMTSEDIKYVINMVLSSLNLSELSEEDKEDIMSKFEETEGDEDMMGTETDSEESFDDITSDTEVEDVQTNMDVPVEEENYGSGAIFDSIFGESKVDNVISKYFEVTKKEILENQRKKLQKESRTLLEIKEKMKEVVKFTESMEQEFMAKKFLEKNPKANFIGKTNKSNLVIENNGKQFKITPRGIIK